jgi:hypothetical protein
VDRIIGDPVRMNESTSLKLDALPPRMRLSLYGVLADRADRIYFRGVSRLGQTAPGDYRNVAVELDFETTNRLIDAIGKSIDGYFRIEELIDLTVFGLSRFEFFPKSQDRWNEIKPQLPKYDLALGSSRSSRWRSWTRPSWTWAAGCSRRPATASASAGTPRRATSASSGIPGITLGIQGARRPASTPRWGGRSTSTRPRPCTPGTPTTRAPSTGPCASTCSPAGRGPTTGRRRARPR